ncbi:GIY-YIG nuclease family protein [Microbacterium sp. BWT-B31]|uniref:GIY-YIG nuclease family protein n=1 Tax=Microbacterium sp. BWT-B31 TaxID=3232072 RepID=UPI003529528F
MNAPLPSPCLLCGASRGERVARRWHCAVCGWRVGDVPDPELPLPRVEVVYYLRFAERVKIGTSSQPRMRLAAIRHEKLLAFERGGRGLERARHAQFAHLREGGEWFTADAALLAHAQALASGADPWDAYARWFSEALRERSA